MATDNKAKTVAREALVVPTRVTGKEDAKPALQAAADRLDKKINPMLDRVAESKRVLIETQSGKTPDQKTTPIVNVRHGGR